MKKVKMRLMGIMIALLIITMLLPISVFAVEESVEDETIQEEITQDVKMQIIEKQPTETEQDITYIIYVKGLLEENFNYAISEESGKTDLELSYFNSKIDEDNNSVIILKGIDTTKNQYLYIKKVTEGKEEFVTTQNGQKLDFNNSFDAAKMELVESTTKRIPTEIKKDEEIKTENGVKITTTTGNLEIEDQNDGATYYYSITKVPEEENTNLENYRTLYNYIEMMNSVYENMDMYSRIELAKQFYNLYIDLQGQQNWVEVQEMKVMQPMDSQNGDKYIVYLRKVSKTRDAEVIDAKFLESYREDQEEKIPEQTETVETKRTSKLPITSDSLILFAVLAVIILALVVVFIRMKKLQNDGKHS